MQLSPSITVPVFILLFALSFYHLFVLFCFCFFLFCFVFYCKGMMCNDLLWFVCYFSVNLLFSLFVCSGCVKERESTSSALSYMLDTIWCLKSALQTFLSLVIVCIRVCVLWQRESSPWGFCWGLSWITLPVKGIVQP